MRNSQAKLIFLTIMVVIVGTRLRGISSQPTDWHAHRQSDTAAVTYRYVQDKKINLLLPRFLDIGEIQSSQDNAEGLRMVEFPFVNAAVASLVLMLPGLPVELASRSVSVFYSLLTGMALFWLAKRWWGVRRAVLVTLIYAWLPFGRFYGRSILPEPALLAYCVACLAFAQAWIDRQRSSWLGLFILHSALAFLLKPIVLFFTPPILFGMLVADQKGWQSFVKKSLILSASFFMSIVPFVAWRWWIARFPEGIPANEWLLNGNGIRLRPAWFRWLFYERLHTMFLGGFASVPFLGACWLVIKKWQAYLPLLGWWFGSLMYLIVIATGNVQHDYYQYVLVVPVALTLGVALDWAFVHVLNIKHKVAWFISALFIVCFGLGFYVADTNIGGLYRTRPDWEHAGQAVSRLTTMDTLVIAPNGSDTGLLYQTHRKGWPMGLGLEAKMAKGASVYVSVTMDDEAQSLAKKYRVLEQTSEYIVIDLLHLQ